jgi:hypothetical protein
MVDLGPVLEAPRLVGERPASRSAAGPLLAALIAMLALAPLSSCIAMSETLAAAALGLLALAAGTLSLTRLLQLPISLRRLLPAIAGLTALALWAAVQALLPLPAGWAPLWDEASAALPAMTVVPRFSFDPAATLDALLRLLSAGAAFWLALQLGRAGARARQALLVLVAVAAIEAGAFLLGAAPRPTLAGAGLCGGLAIFFDRMADDGGPGRGFGPALSHFLQRLGTHGMPALGAILLLGAGVSADAAARPAAAAGALAALLALIATPSLAILRRRGLLALWFALLLALLAIGAAAAVHHAGDPAAAAARQAALFALLDHPLTGIGLGAADAALPLYREPHMEAMGPLPGFLALALGAGLPAAGAFVLGMLFLAALCAIGLWRRRRNGAFPAAALGVIVMMTLSGVPSFAALLAWAVLLGLGAAHSFRTGAG